MRYIVYYMEFTSLSNDEDGPLPIRNVAFNKQSVTASQVHILLGIIAHAQNVLDRHDAAGEESGGAKCGGVRCAVETNLLNAAARLDDILEDKSRWDTTGVDSISDAVKAVHTQHVKTLKAQQEHIEAEIRPAFMFRPQIFKLNGRWWAVHGGEEIENKVAGSGITAHAAVLDFEIQYYTQNAAIEGSDDKKTLD